MENLHSETLEFLVRFLKAKQLQFAGAGTFADRKACKKEMEHLRKRITLEFYYQTNGKSAGETPQ